MLRAKALDERDGLPHQAFDFQFDIEKAIGAVALDDAGERGRAMRRAQDGEVGEGMQIDLAAPDAGIVQQDAVLILRQANVEFKAVAAVLQGKIEGAIGVLLRVTARAAMSQKQRTSTVEGHETSLRFTVLGSQ